MRRSARDLLLGNQFMVLWVLQHQRQVRDCAISPVKLLWRRFESVEGDNHVVWKLLQQSFPAAATSEVVSQSGRHAQWSRELVMRAFCQQKPETSFSTRINDCNMLIAIFSCSNWHVVELLLPFKRRHRTSTQLPSSSQVLKIILRSCSEAQNPKIRWPATEGLGEIYQGGYKQYMIT